MNTPISTTVTLGQIRIHADHGSQKRLGNWTTARAFEVRARRSRAGRGKVKQTYHHNPAGTGRQIRLSGQIRHGEVRVHSGGIARLSAMASRQYLAAARRAHAEGTAPPLDNPAHRS